MWNLVDSSQLSTTTSTTERGGRDFFFISVKISYVASYVALKHYLNFVLSLDQMDQIHHIYNLA